MGGGGAPSTGLDMFNDVVGGSSSVMGGIGVGMKGGVVPDQNIKDLWSVMESLLNESISPHGPVQLASPTGAWCLDSILADPLNGSMAGGKHSSSEPNWQDQDGGLMAAISDRIHAEGLTPGQAPNVNLNQLGNKQDIVLQAMTGLGVSADTMPALACGPVAMQQCKSEMLETDVFNGGPGMRQLANQVQAFGGGDLWDLLPEVLKQQDSTMSTMAPATFSLGESSFPGGDNRHRTNGLLKQDSAACSLKAGMQEWDSSAQQSCTNSQSADESSSSIGPIPISSPPASQLSPASVAPVRIQPSPSCSRAGHRAGVAVPSQGTASPLPALGILPRRASGSSLRSRRGLPDLPVTPRDKPPAAPPPAVMGGPRTPSPKSCKRESEGLQSSVPLGAVKWEPCAMNKSPRAGEAQRSPGGARITGIPPRSPSGILAGEMALLAMNSMSPTASGMESSQGLPGGASPLVGGAGLGVSHRTGLDGGASLNGDCGGIVSHLPSPGLLSPGLPSPGLPSPGQPSPGTLKRIREEEGSLGMQGGQVATSGGTGGAADMSEPEELSDAEEEQEGQGTKDGEGRPGAQEKGSSNRTKQSTKPRSVAERMRRERISIRLQRLKEVMPKTDARIDTAAMLEDAVTYIKSLQSRCKLLERNNAALVGQLEVFSGRGGVDSR